MFRVSQYMQTLAAGNEATLAGPRGTGQGLPGPVVIWNLIRRCNLTCKHCYAISADKDFEGELSTEEVFTTMQNLRDFKVPVLILSGGEPLLRPDIFEVSARAKQLGFYVGLSTNGTLINEDNIDHIADADYNYVGVSIDGLRDTHDKFRRLDGAFDLSMHGIDLCQQRDIRVGLRFTMTSDNAHELPQMLDDMEARGLDRFYLSHLNYAGRGNHNRGSDAVFQATREALDLLFDRAWADAQKGGSRDYVTGNNDADGVYFLMWVEKNLPDRVDEVRAMLSRWGGNSSGRNIANIDNLGNVHPDTMWWHHNLGSVRERPFSEIWMDTSDPLMAGLKQKPRVVKGRCAACSYFDICGGNTRVRAWQLTGDAWAEDPGCYLSDEEIGNSMAGERLKVVSFADARLQSQGG